MSGSAALPRVERRTARMLLRALTADDDAEFTWTPPSRPPVDDGVDAAAADA